MAIQIAYCGIECLACPAYVATHENSDEKRRQVSALWKKQYNLDIRPEDLNCDGCLSSRPGNPNCPIRVCARSNKLVNCAYCPDYVCETLVRFFRADPRPKETLDRVKKRDQDNRKEGDVLKR